MSRPSKERLAEIRAGAISRLEGGSAIVLELLAEIDALTQELADMTRSHEIVDQQNDRLAAQVATLREALASTRDSLMDCWCKVATIDEDGTQQHEPECAAFQRILAGIAPTQRDADT